jgi:hypothetical protein
MFYTNYTQYSYHRLIPTQTNPYTKRLLNAPTALMPDPARNPIQEIRIPGLRKHSPILPLPLLSLPLLPLFTIPPPLLLQPSLPLRAIIQQKR